VPWPVSRWHMAPPQPPAKRLRSALTTVPKRRSLSNASAAVSSVSRRPLVAGLKHPPPGTSVSATKKKADAGQLSLGFTQRDPYPAGMKFLLPETIYPNAALVRNKICVSLIYNFFFLTVIFSMFGNSFL
jgi:hypothetical protein